LLTCFLERPDVQNQDSNSEKIIRNLLHLSLVGFGEGMSFEPIYDMFTRNVLPDSLKTLLFRILIAYQKDERLISVWEDMFYNGKSDFISYEGWRVVGSGKVRGLWGSPDIEHVPTEDEYKRMIQGFGLQGLIVLYSQRAKNNDYKTYELNFAEQISLIFERIIFSCDEIQFTEFMRVLDKRMPQNLCAQSLGGDLYRSYFYGKLFDYAVEHGWPEWATKAIEPYVTFEVFDY
ncbi:MAG: hypothetical protein HZA36_01140, partial [Parcubacteria group bacterium]|nr:hypothetical protein [Parcubacteria group bacterium]